MSSVACCHGFVASFAQDWFQAKDVSEIEVLQSEIQAELLSTVKAPPVPAKGITPFIVMIV
eukprot:665545-Amphidinium_carterae.1